MNHLYWREICVGFMQYTRVVDCSDMRVDRRKLEPPILRHYRTKQRTIKQNNDCIYAVGYCRMSL
jgi:hypothetical protein